LLGTGVHRQQQARSARRQAAILAACGVVIAAAVVAFVQRPADDSDLKIPVAELRSQSLELRLLDRELAHGLAGRFVRAHAGQLARAIDRSRDELATLKTVVRLEGAKAEALRRSMPLVAAAAALHDGDGPLPELTLAQVADAGAALQALEERLRQ
jgi:hypothetical protein